MFILELSITLSYSFSSRYNESNIRSASTYRQYNYALPKWLPNRLRQFVIHCQHHLLEATNTKKEHKKDKASSLLTVKMTAHVLTVCNLVIATQCLPDWQKHHASIFWLFTRTFLNGDGKPWLLPTAVQQESLFPDKWQCNQPIPFFQRHLPLTGTCNLKYLRHHNRMNNTENGTRNTEQCCSDCKH